MKCSNLGQTCRRHSIIPSINVKHFRKGAKNLPTDELPYFSSVVMIQLKGSGQLASQLNLPIKVSRCLEQWFPLLIMMELFKTQPTTVNGINWQKDENDGKLLTTVTAFFSLHKKGSLCRRNAEDG
uniref:Uncharacterized protein n=1 Tax=Micrurus surinamensis TaxID=129470 RepID=A0A2D4PYK9_MICSU